LAAFLRQVARRLPLHQPFVESNTTTGTLNSLVLMVEQEPARLAFEPLFTVLKVPLDRFKTAADQQDLF
jgi:hypothetical protein